jgi:hypothetical protein
MEKEGMLKNSQIIILGLCIAVATIVSSLIISQGFLKVMRFSREVITVTGSAQKEIMSDYVVWSCTVTKREVDLASAYKNLKADVEKVKIYFGKSGISKEEMIISQITTETVYKKNEKGNDTNDIEGYKLKQSVELRSGDVEKITGLSRGSTELIDQGVQFESWAPDYFYTKIDELKIEMLAKATENAKARAENMAKATGNKIGVMRSAKMGVFQITPVNSTDVSDWGVYDTTSPDKKVTAVVNVSFAIE